eukprot:Gregarina_sp_Pseudo_9__2913@NODE_312_length_3195_cov_37_855196_g293_i0_p4_GENE_NODE_312_length_3195_cov_37_855196_g293_i0NODE_312_length_3195_cov_37_855196_g293_i0_p4_ORF_typecomplete_len154_score19_81Prominin/PF05478_11/0_025Glycophorin_A/PF01102_18/0_085Mid2/PF04478_12/0_1DUF3827/PF12877_7/0_18_NODE_312_length_3195_cov_37_855196_g293_i0152613
MASPSPASSDAFKLLLSALGSAQPRIAAAVHLARSKISTAVSAISTRLNASFQATRRQATTMQVSYSNLIIIVIGVAVVFSALIWLLRLTCGQRNRNHLKRPWSPMYRKSSYSSRCLREAISSKAPFAEASRRETVLYKMGNAFSARQRRDMF